MHKFSDVFLCKVFMVIWALLMDLILVQGLRGDNSQTALDTIITPITKAGVSFGVVLPYCVICMVFLCAMMFYG